ncbi:MAG TPA: YchF/TatD family DNA exonuclease [Nitrospinota bacterium]|nr:YchF/TatD family DNA exonuclease [Nitrospinota bacterium]|tara:strand:+ start:193012 stop:194385 length:1374 start_codon:yes stop_codon:yes gene_type:complete
MALADSHCHLNDQAFDEDRDEVIERSRKSGVEIILNVGYSIENSHKAIVLAEKYQGMYASVGIHPHHASTVTKKSIRELKEMAEHPMVIAIGETGLDYYRNQSPKNDQVKSFRTHINLAKETSKPVIVHCRDAMEDTLKILSKERIKKVCGVMHCYSGTDSDVSTILDLGMYISFSANITYPKAHLLRDAMMATPGHRLLLETDSPYLAPQKKRGTRNEPSNLAILADNAARIRGISREDIERISVSNFKTLFNIEDTGNGRITYKIRNSLYVNVTKECTNECSFCTRFYSDSVQGHNLRITHDPTAIQMIKAIGDPSIYDEIVFCGFGEPTLHLDRILEVAKSVKKQGGKVRLNTNGHGSIIANQDITPALSKVVDHISVSMNAADKDTYDNICQPLMPNAFDSMLKFIKDAKKCGIKVTASVVAIPDKVDVEKCRKLAEVELGVRFRVRNYNLVG